MPTHPPGRASVRAPQVDPQASTHIAGDRLGCCVGGWLGGSARDRSAGPARRRRAPGCPPAADDSEPGPGLGRRHAGAGVLAADLQLDRRPRARGDQRRRRQRDHRRDRGARPVRLRARPMGLRRDRRLAQEPRAHRRVLFHRAARLLRSAHRPPRQRGRDRRRAVPRTGAPGGQRRTAGQDRRRAAQRSRCGGRRGPIGCRGRGRAAIARRRSRRTVAASALAARHGARPQRGVACHAGRVRARDARAGRDHRDPLRPAREPGRDGHPAAAGRRPVRPANPFPAWPQFVPDPPRR